MAIKSSLSSLGRANTTVGSYIFRAVMGFIAIVLTFFSFSAFAKMSQTPYDTEANKAKRTEHRNSGIGLLVVSLIIWVVMWLQYKYQHLVNTNEDFAAFEGARAVGGAASGAGDALLSKLLGY